MTSARLIEVSTLEWQGVGDIIKAGRGMYTNLLLNDSKPVPYEGFSAAARFINASLAVFSSIAIVALVGVLTTLYLRNYFVMYLLTLALFASLDMVLTVTLERRRENARAERDI